MWIVIARQKVSETAAFRDDHVKLPLVCMCMESLVASRNFMAQMEASAAAAGAPTFVSAKPSGTRGRILGVGQLSGAGRHVQAKIHAGMYSRPASRRTTPTRSPTPGAWSCGGTRGQLGLWEMCVGRCVVAPATWLGVDGFRRAARAASVS